LQKWRAVTHGGGAVLKLAAIKQGQKLNYKWYYSLTLREELFLAFPVPYNFSLWNLTRLLWRQSAFYPASR
jgi:hypothetical protein